MGLQVVALGCLIGAIVLGFVKKTNVGLVCFGLALILGKIGGMDASDIYKGFPFKLFATLLGTMLFFSLLQQNGTLEKISDRLIGLCGKHLFLVPIIIYVVSFGLSAAGPGAISVQSVTVLFAVALAVQMKVSPILMGVMAILGAVGGTASPIALTGIIVGDMMTEMGIEGSINNIFIGVSVSNFVCAVAMYILLGGYKLRGNAESGEKKVEKFTRNQWLSLIALVIMVVLVVGFSYDVGLLCFTLAMILILLGTADEKKAIKAIPWSVLILIAGVNVLMNITQTMGGIDLLSSILASFMTKRTAGSIMGFTAGLMSWFSSANGVVFPTLIPTVPDIASQVGGASVMQIITAIVCSATVAGISPLSTGGSLILASYAQETDCSDKEQQKMFGTLFALSATVVVIVCVLTFIGVTSFVG
ncbi:SLC13 family permease [Clostridium sp. AF02-29]|uniref:SLC13 family permease n=1 Tax=Clostridium sp. AF02-29 TaxID=2292993 RepID=UPI000E49FE86|nr:SLC13 family permease [Clostridium sp. AF02-29]RHS42085.1 C4-dicarboxylate ABC transporter [Clostridium sp. AF02-29]